MVTAAHDNKVDGNVRWFSRWQKGGQAPFLLTESTPGVSYSAFNSCRWSFFSVNVGAASIVVATTDHSVSHRTHVQLDGADCVIVARDDVVNAFRAAVGVDNADDRDTQLVGFGDRDALVI